VDRLAFVLIGVILCGLPVIAAALVALVVVLAGRQRHERRRVRDVDVMQVRAEAGQVRGIVRAYEKVGYRCAGIIAAPGDKIIELLFVWKD
jgi:hypothetical protein